jgi:hypothetical protein
VSYRDRKTPLGVRQLTAPVASADASAAKNAAATTVGIPAGTDFAIIVNGSANDARWTDDGVAPTASFGILLKAGAALSYDGDPNKLKVIRTGASDAVLDIACYGA